MNDEINQDGSEMDPEDSMDELDIEPIEEIEVLTEDIASKRNSNVDMMLAQAINLNNGNALHEPTCSICCSPLRNEAEDTWEKTRRTAMVVELFLNRGGVEIGNEVVKNHMKHHLDHGIQEIQKVEYVDRIRRLYSQNVTTLDRLDLCIAVVTDRLMQINSLTPSGDKSIADIEKIKSAETVKLMNTYSNLIKLQATLLGEMKDSGEMISIPSKKFVSVFNTALSLEVKTDREREIVMGLLRGLQGK